jgi:hypothetical protein
MFTPNLDHIIIQGDFTGTGELIVSNEYDFKKFGSQSGSVKAYYTATLEGPLFGAASQGGEFLKVATAGSSFSNNTALAAWNAPPAGTLLPLSFSIFDMNEGYFSGPGTLTGGTQWSAGDLEKFSSPQTIDVVAQVPEPSMLTLLGVYTISRWSARRRKRVDDHGRDRIAANGTDA